MINTLRNKISVYLEKRMHFKYNGSRNQIEEFVGYIDKLYPNIFTIKVVNGGYIKSFSYNDVLIHKLVFKSGVI